MIKLVYCLRRQPHLSRAAFQAYWRTVHGPLVVERGAALGIRRYVQCHTLDDPAHAGLRASRGSAEPYDGIAELWLDAAGSTGPQARHAALALLDDERRFIDLARSCLFVTAEHELVPLRDPIV